MSKPRGPRPSPVPSSSGTTRPVKPVSSSRVRPVPASPPSSTAVPRRPPTGPHKPVAPAPRAEPEVVVASEEEEISTVRRRVHASPPRGRTFSLRDKIVLSTAGITLVTGLIVFIVVYVKAADLFNEEINAKGVALLNTLASIDEDYWITAIHTREESRQAEFDTLVERLGGQTGWKEVLRSKPELEAAYRRALDPFGPVREAEIQEILKMATGGLDWRPTLENNPPLKRIYERIVRPLPSLKALRPLRDLAKAQSQGLLDAGVVDMTGGSANAPGISIQGPIESNLPAPARGEVLTIRDLPYKRESVQIMGRMFTRNPPPEAPRQLRHYVVLSLEGISEAKGALMWAVLIPVFVSGLLGVGIAVWVSTLITDPIKRLMSDINEVSNGNLDHQTVAHSRDEIGQLATTFNKMTQALKLAHTQELATKALEHDLTIASEIQSNLVPKRMLKIPGYDISAYYRPSKEVGGDYYDFITIDEDNEGIIVADVSGKGIPGSLVMSMARAFIRMEAERSRNTSPADTLVRANRMLAQDIKKGMFVTALYCILNKKTREIRVASAGHNPLVVWRAAADKIELVNPSGIALGFDKGPVFERTIREEKIVLEPGDRIVAYTDGVVEAMNAQNQEFGDKRFQDLVQDLGARDSNQLLNLIMKAIDEFRGDAPQSDDITIVTLRLL